MENPPFTALPPAIESFADSIVIPVYTPTTTGALLSASLAADGRDVVVRLDDQPEPVARWSINGAADASVFVGLEAGFHLLTLTLDPPCVISPDPTLVCRQVSVARLSLEKG
ncbi:MAG: hypothetical protein IPK19_39645 [Chloroflexi bacterium]|nr:hypothetical protein [Chloroflexota bacterium]